MRRHAAARTLSASIVAVALIASLSALPAAVSASGGPSDGWQNGRATKYGNDGGSTVHEGSCMFGNLDPNKGTGLDIAALSDTDPEYAGSCGRCYEVGCVDSDVVDGFGQTVGRRGSCYDTSRTVVVTITDTCPCHYPSNWQSNKRWCCGDEPHMDLSYTAFRKLADEGLGVIAVRWRRVQCPAGAPTHPKCDHLPSCFNTDNSAGAPLPSAGSSSSSSSDAGSQGSNTGSNSGGGSWVWDDNTKKSTWVDFSSQKSNSDNSNGKSGSWVWDESSKKSTWVDFSAQQSASNSNSHTGGGSWVWDDNTKKSTWVDAASLSQQQQQGSTTSTDTSNSGSSGSGGSGWWGWDSSSKTSKWVDGGRSSWGGWASRFGSRRRAA